MTAPRIPAELAALAVPIDTLQPYGKNPRRGNVAMIAESLDATGQYRPVVVRKGTNEVLAGNHTVQAAKSLGWPEIAATYVDCDDVVAARIVLIDNRAGDMGSYDEDVLAELLDTLPDLEGTGYNAADLDDLISGTLESEHDSPSGLGDPVVGYQIVFDDETQQARWYEFLRWLKREHPDLETLGERLTAHLGGMDL